MKLAAFLCTTLLAAGPAVYAERDIKLSGCLVRGEGDGAGYLLTNAPGEPGWLDPERDRVTPSAVGTTGGFATIFYWLDGTADLRDHIGHRVEIEGELRSDLRDGEIKVDRKDKWTELTVKSEGRALKAHVPNSAVAFGSDDERKGEVLIRRVDVEKVRMLGASCN